ncbi:polynucleotide adenylyltransferase PcnB [Treponema putidum]|uniref:Polynucleotide adenylyltransferase PcnB n=1 Tax=Treponema putidum TaxID=221027 RepID=A0AAE9MXG6_9SPIR|nr:polynucleotide adenylyltransferase PcnB [Treponema putidum]UTY30028.1 polynucleotide adenylyltransferase PcnB [Treponema putidum]UTY32483.1 polynucleotide adenylyltransferase PcnB [Treponema putidum]UTY34883.1 polynucleotide adenylyltransferase PcnB [Treponema putidum]
MLVRYGQNAEGKQVRQALVYTKDEHHIAPEKIDIEAVKIIQRLNSQGFEAYIVGGAVRDLLIGHIPKDFDIATSAEPSKIRKMFRNSRVIGRRFRLVHVFFGEKIYEVSTFRSTEDGSIGNKFGTIDEDVHRRDFTLNALYYDPIHELVIDYVGGVKDIREKKIRPIIPLKLIFSEDPVRMIRAIKYAAMTDSGIPFFVQLQIHKNAHLLEFVSPSRITEEINKIIFSGHASDIIKKLLDFKLYVYLQPGACAFIDSSSKFKEVYIENLALLDKDINVKPQIKQGECLKPLLKDYIKLIADPEGQLQEVYTYVYKECRHFILPMNPQRRELEFAVKSILNDLGIKVPMDRTQGRPAKLGKQTKHRRKKRVKKQDTQKDTD